MRKHPLLVGVACVVLAGCLGGCAGRDRVRPVRMGGVESGPGSLQDVRRQLEGKWALTSLQLADTAGTLVSVPASGHLTYDAYGNFVLDIEAEPAALQPLGDKPVVLDLKGRAVIDAAGGLLQVQDVVPADGTTVPPGLERVRQFEFRGDTLTLTVRNASGRRTGVTTWKRQP